MDRLIRPDFLPHVRGNFDADRLNRFAGGEPAMLPAVSPDPMGQAAMPQPDAYEWFTKVSADRAPNWKNEMTARSLEMAGEFDPGSFISQISPTPLLMIIADEDACTPYALAFDAYERAREPKQLVVTHGGHFDFYKGPGLTRSPPPHATTSSPTYAPDRCVASRRQPGSHTCVPEAGTRTCHFRTTTGRVGSIHRQPRLSTVKCRRCPPPRPLTDHCNWRFPYDYPHHIPRPPPRPRRPSDRVRRSLAQHPRGGLARHPGGTFSPTTATLITGPTEAVLIDAQYLKDDVRDLGDLIERTGKKLTTIYVTHAHADHYLGIGPLKERFPDAKCVALPHVVEAMKESMELQRQQWAMLFGDACVVGGGAPRPDRRQHALRRRLASQHHRGEAGRHPSHDNRAHPRDRCRRCR